MTENKLILEEVKRALENLLFNRKCQIAKSGEKFITLGEILDLINRQQAEIEYLERSNKMSQHLLSSAYESIERLDKLNENAKSEALKEFVERFEDKINGIDLPKYAVVEKMLVIYKQALNDTVKEMVGDDK